MEVQKNRRSLSVVIFLRKGSAHLILIRYKSKDVISPCLVSQHKVLGSEMDFDIREWSESYVTARGYVPIDHTQARYFSSYRNSTFSIDLTRQSDIGR